MNVSPYSDRARDARLSRYRSQLADLEFTEFIAWLRAHRGDRTLRFRPEDACHCPLAIYCDYLVGVSPHDAVARIHVDGTRFTLEDTFRVVEMQPWQGRFMSWFDGQAWEDPERVGIDELLAQLETDLHNKPTVFA